MLRKLDSPEFLSLLGKLVLGFGSMELTVSTTILIISSDGDGKLAGALVPPSNSISQNLDLLQRVCLISVSEAALPHWIDAISDLRELFTERNRIYHGDFVEQGNDAILQRILKGKNGKEDYYHDVAIDDQFLIALESRLSNRYQQLRDFAMVATKRDPAKELAWRAKHLSRPDGYPPLSL